jgi:hypothetical protein
VDPVQPTRDRKTGLIELRHLRPGQARADPAGELGQPGSGTRAVIAAIVLAETGVPNNSASALAVRSLDSTARN